MIGARKLIYSSWPSGFNKKYILDYRLFYMDLRSDTLVYPFDTIPLDPGPFLGENPPTNKEVLLKLKGYEKQTGSKYKKDMRYALMKVSNDIKE